MRYQTIHLHVQAPPKPAPGTACNGCGVCCALETCPVARLRFLKNRGPCPALDWSEEKARYFCGLLARPGSYFGWLPRFTEPLAKRLLHRWIATGHGCDCKAEIES